ncbi:MAG: hypothetical protein AAGG81_07975, partial [Chlamydiota bacterium]
RLSNSKQSGVVFTRSSKINEMEQVAETWVETYLNNKNTLYNWIAYKLIPMASVRLDEKTKEYRLFFNDKLSVGFSDSCSIPFRDQNRVVDFFLNEDGWSVSGKTERSGIDPVGVYWTIQKLVKYPAAKEALETLLLGDLIPDEHPALSNAKQFVGENGEEASLVMSAYELISDIGRSFGTIYKNPFYQLWDELASSKEAPVPLLKEKAEGNINQLGRYVDWVPSLSASPDFPVEPLTKVQSVLTPIWKDIHKYRIDKSIKGVDNIPFDRSEALDLLSQQYYWIHINVDDPFDEDGAGCILSALCVYIYQASEKLENINSKDMRDLFSDYLVTLLNTIENKPSEIDRQVYDYFNTEVKKCTKGDGINDGWSLEEYAEWLRNGKSPEGKQIYGHFDMGQLEIDLFCRVFRIGVQVFRGGEPYRLEKGLMLPIRSYGPRTREQVILFNETGVSSDGFSFYALMPKLRSPISYGSQRDSSEIKSALKHNRDFWERNHEKDWGQ